MFAGGRGFLAQILGLAEKISDFSISPNRPNHTHATSNGAFLDTTVRRMRKACGNFRMRMRIALPRRELRRVMAFSPLTIAGHVSRGKATRATATKDVLGGSPDVEPRPAIFSGLVPTSTPGPLASEVCP